MTYKVTINGKEYTLPARTAEMNDRIEGIERIQQRKARGEITSREAVTEQYAFVADCIHEPLPPIEEIDVGDLTVAALEIINAYLLPDIQAQTETLARTVRTVTDRREVQDLFRLHGVMNAQKKHKR